MDTRPAAGFLLEGTERPTNPKDRIGRNKPQLWLIPGPGLIHLALAFKNGGDKYGPYNWRDNAVKYTIYLDAALRHIHALLDGEDKAGDSGLHHASHAAACMLIILDALETGNLIDDRPTKGVTAELIERFKLDQPKDTVPTPPTGAVDWCWKPLSECSDSWVSGPDGPRSPTDGRTDPS